MPGLQNTSVTVPAAVLRTLPAAGAPGARVSVQPLRSVAAAPEDPVALLRESVTALVAMDAERLQSLAARSLRAQKLRAWKQMPRREQAMFLAERALLEALIEETRRNMRLLRSLSAAVAPARPRADGSAYAATGALWVD